MDDTVGGEKPVDHMETLERSRSSNINSTLKCGAKKKNQIAYHSRLLFCLRFITCAMR